MKTMKTKYILMFVIDGAANQIEYPAAKKSQAISDLKNIRLRAQRIKLFSIDSEDNEIWYDLTNRY